MSPDPFEFCEPAAPAKATPDVLAPQMSRGIAAWGLLIIAGGLAAYYRTGPLICKWWFAPAQPDGFCRTAFYASLLLALAVLLTFALVPLPELRNAFSKADLTAQLSWGFLGAVFTFAFEVLSAAAYWLWFRPTEVDVNAVARTLVAAAGTEKYAGALVIVVLIGAAAEELLFRGLLLRYLTGLLRNPRAAILIAAAAFGLGHLGYSYINAVVAFWMGLVLGVLYVRRGSLLTVIVAHFLYNFANLQVGLATQPPA
jgi:membrane protease YdiL (CAAX protease family)